MAATEMPGGGMSSYPYRPELGASLGGQTRNSGYPAAPPTYAADAPQPAKPSWMGAPQGYQAKPHVAPVPSAGLTAGRLSQFAGAAISLTLLIGVLVWGYQLVMRDVTGIPVVKATQSPMRIAPEDPGGRQAAHQGLAVNEVAGRGAAAGPVDQLILAPTPVDLTSEDATAPELRLTSVAPVDAPATVQTQSAQASRLTPQDAAIQALADQIASGVTPLAEVAPLADAAVETTRAPVTDVPTVASQIAAVATVQRPRARPASIRTASAAAMARTAPAASSIDVAAASLPAGTRLVQLGAYDSEDVARQEWTRIAGKFDTFFDGKSRVIQQAQSGGRTFYRLRAHGFGDLADARRFCAALVAERTDCIPVVTR